MTDAPELQAERSSALQWRVWCRYCRAFHYHGIGAGHRAAHCATTTPYTATGYTLIAPKADQERSL